MMFNKNSILSQSRFQNGNNQAMSNIISINSNWQNNRNEERHEAYYRNEKSRLFQSNKAMHMMARVISGKT